MTLYTTDYLEYYFTLVGWIVHNGIWNVLVASGVFAFPFLAIVLQEWLRARGEGADEGNKGVLSAMRIETRVWVAVFVIVFAGIPLIQVDLGSIEFDQTRSTQCQVNVPVPADTGWQPAFTELNGQSAQVPLWWFFMHAISKAITAAAVAAIPCGTDLRQIRMDIANTRIADPTLAQEVADFTRDCYGPARARLFATRPNLGPAESRDVTWIGSSTFLNGADYYGDLHSSTPREGFDYDDDRDAGLARVPSGAGYPTCEEWWSDENEGLRSRLLGQVDPTLMERIVGWATFMSREEVDDSVIRAIASPSRQVVNRGEVYPDYGGRIGPSITHVANRTASDIGLTFGSLAFLPSMDVVRQALPIVLSLLKMALVISIPLVLLFGTYGAETVVTITCVEFALFFCDFWFQFARWLDSTILDALYGWNAPHSNFNPLFGLNNAFGDMLMDYIFGAAFLLLPTFWVTALTWAGIRAGNFVSGLTVGTQDARSAGGRGIGAVMSVVGAARGGAK
jgi:hypothetical protein